MKIAIFAPSFLPKASGAEIFHHNLATRLSAEGHSVTVVLTSSAWKQWQQNPPSVSYSIARFPSLPVKVFKRFPALGLMLAGWMMSSLQIKFRFDVWHVVCLDPTGLMAMSWSARSGIPVVFRPVGDDLSTHAGIGTLADPQLLALTQKLLPLAPAVIALSKGMVNDCLALGAVPDRIIEIPNAMDAARLAGSSARKSAARETHGIPSDIPLLLSVGRNHPQKNYPVLLDAYQLMQAQGVRFQAVIVGRDTEALLPLIAQRGLDEVVRCSEVKVDTADLQQLPPDALLSWYHCADVFVMPSLLEGFSTAMLEAAAAGLPIVTTDGPGCADFIRHGLDGCMVPASNVEALAITLQELIESASVREQWSKAALARAADFSWEMTISRYVALYRKLIAEPHPAGTTDKA